MIKTIFNFNKTRVRVVHAGGPSASGPPGNLTFILLTDKGERMTVSIPELTVMWARLRDKYEHTDDDSIFNDMLAEHVKEWDEDFKFVRASYGQYRKMFTHPSNEHPWIFYER
jgi:hypothetical protein